MLRKFLLVCNIALIVFDFNALGSSISSGHAGESAIIAACVVIQSFIFAVTLYLPVLVSKHEVSNGEQ